MADEDPSQEKTEEPTSKRLRDAKEKGQSPRSRDLNSFIVLMFSGFAFISLGQITLKNIAELARSLFSFDASLLSSNDKLMDAGVDFIVNVLYTMLPFFFISLLAGLLGPILIGGWTFSSKAIAPKISKMNPLKGLKRMFSAKALMELVKAFLKFSVVAVVATIVWWGQLHDFLTIGDLPVTVGIPKAFTMIAWSFVFISFSLFIIVVIDVPFQLFEHRKQLKMTKQEIKDEYKETEGKPEVKAQIRRLQIQAANKRMMAEVPKADVILTNPSHFSVALAYDEQGYTAPLVLAKGVDHMAIHIGKIAKEAGVPILRLPPLARSIYYSTEVGEEIPRGLFIAVAQVLAYIFQLKRKNRLDEVEAMPDELSELPIPEELKR